MSYYDNYEWDNVMYEIKEFLKHHKLSELLMIVQAAAEQKEEGFLN